MAKRKEKDKEEIKRKVGQQALVGQSILIEGDKVPHCPFCNESLVNSTLKEVDLVQNKQNKKERILKFERECGNCFNKVIVYREMISAWSESNYLQVDENDWEKIKEEKVVFKDE